MCLVRSITISSPLKKVQARPWISVLVFSVIGSAGFKFTKFEPFYFDASQLSQIGVTKLVSVTPAVIFSSMGLGFCLSILFFMDQNISAALTMSPEHNLKKPGGYHLDLLVVAFINLILTLLGLPWMHGALPHSPLHARALADFEEVTSIEPKESEQVSEVITGVRETRISSILAHILLGFSLFLLPTPLTSIPKPVLDGLFLFVALTSLFFIFGKNMRKIDKFSSFLVK